MHIESKRVLINTKAEIISAFIALPDNFGKILPSQIKNWSSEGNYCFFTIEGLTDMHLEMQEHQEGDFVLYQSTEKNKIKVKLKIALTPLGSNETEAQFHLDAVLNPMMAMMAKRPLNNFVNLLADELQKSFISGE